MSSRDVSLTASGTSDWVQVHGPKTLRFFGTWVGSAQLEMKHKDDPDSAAAAVGAAKTVPEAFKLNIEPTDNDLMIRVNYTHTSGTFQAKL